MSDTSMLDEEGSADSDEGEEGERIDSSSEDDGAESDRSDYGTEQAEDMRSVVAASQAGSGTTNVSAPPPGAEGGPPVRVRRLRG